MLNLDLKTAFLEANKREISDSLSICKTLNISVLDILKMLKIKSFFRVFRYSLYATEIILYLCACNETSANEGFGSA